MEIRIADFGLARGNDSPYIVTQGSQAVAVAWTAPECPDFGFTVKSDVVIFELKYA